jgi:hypothetical protein
VLTRRAIELAKKRARSGPVRRVRVLSEQRERWRLHRTQCRQKRSPLDGRYTLWIDHFGRASHVRMPQRRNKYRLQTFWSLDAERTNCARGAREQEILALVSSRGRHCDAVNCKPAKKKLRYGADTECVHDCAETDNATE